MPGIIGLPHHNYDRHVRLSQEAAFGTVNPAPTWWSVPILGDGWKLKASNTPFFPETNLAGYVRTAIQHSLVVEGGFTTLAWPEPLNYLLGMAFNRNPADYDVYSHTADYLTPPDPRRYTGTVVETLAIRVTGTGDADVQLEFGLRARQEAGLDTLVIGDYDYSDLTCVPFMFRDAHLELDAVHIMDIEEFTINLDNSVSQGPYARHVGLSPFGLVAYLVAGRRSITLDIGDACKDDRFNQVIRAPGVVSFEASFFHPDGHLWQIQLPMLIVESSDETASQSDPTKEAGLLHAVAPCVGGTGGEIAWSVDLGPAGSTTTLAALTTTAAVTTTTTMAATTTTTAP